MKKILLILFLFLIPFSLALDHCSDKMDTSIPPCELITPWEYPAPCSGNLYIFYNSSGENIINYSMQEWNNSGFCYSVFNITTMGDYKFKTNLGDTGNIKIGDKMTNILIYGGYLLVMFILILFMHLFKKDTGTPIVYGVIGATISVLMLALQLSGFNVISGYTLIVDLNYYIMALTVALGLYSGVISYAFYSDIRPKQEEAY